MNHILPCILITVVSGWSASSEVTFESLLYEMTDLANLAEFPEPAYICRQFSSYDPRSTDPNEPTDENWFANWDRGHHIRTEEQNGRTEWVMMDAEGPGAIVRIWSANPIDAGILRIYLDGEETPTWELSATTMLGAGAFPFIHPISGMRSMGWNAFLPIPYAEHCKVTASSPDFYYHVNYRTYEAGTSVRTLTPSDCIQNASLIREVAQRLQSPAMPSLPSAIDRHHRAFRLEPGGDTSALSFDTGNAVYRIVMNVQSDDIETALRGAVLRIKFDGHQTVETPLGDFFGTAPGINAYTALPAGVLGDGTLYSHWVMPYRKQVTLSIQNTSSTPIDIEMTLVTGSYEWRENTLYFHAGWRGDYPIPTQPRQDWNYLECTGGRGVYVGNALHITNPTPTWWGEGDEKIYIDGEDFPSTFGTGTEDYYGYAWCCPDVFVHAYHNQPRCDGPQNFGHTSLNRFHIIDALPFNTSFRFDMEVWHWEDVEIGMSVVNYWYADTGINHSLTSVDPDMLFVPPVKPLVPDKESSIPGRYEAETFLVTSLTKGEIEIQTSVEWGWSNNRQLWWTGGDVGERIGMVVPVPKSGKYEIFAVFTSAPDYGIFSININDQEAIVEMDLFETHVKPTEEISLGAYDLEEGAFVLSATCIGTNEKAAPVYMFGLDYVKLVALETNKQE